MSTPFNITRVSTRDGLDVLFSFDSQEDVDRFLEEGVVEIWAPGLNGQAVKYHADNVRPWLSRQPDFAEPSNRYRVFLTLMDTIELSKVLGHDIAMHLTERRNEGSLRIVVREGEQKQTFAVEKEDLRAELEESRRQKRIEENLKKIKVVPFPSKENNK